MKTVMDNVREFTKKGNQPIDVPIDDVEGSAVFGLRLKLIGEEFKEMAEAMNNWTKGVIQDYPAEEQRILKEHILKEMCDCVYVIAGMAATYGWDMTEAWRRVHESNMSKFGEKGILKDKDGKVLKPDTYKPADLEGCV